MATFNPINVAEDRDEFGRPVDRIGDAVEALSLAPAPSPSPEPQPNPEPLEDPVQEAPRGPSMMEKFGIEGVVPADRAPQEAVTSTPMMEKFGIRPVGYQPEITAQTSLQQYTTAMLPQGVEPGSYSPEDLSTNDDLFMVVKSSLENRYGVQAVQGQSREEVVDRFLNNRRGVAMAGNSVRVLSETDFLYGIKNDQERMRIAAQGYALYENMAGITSDETSWGEALSASWDVTRGIVLDPINIVSLGVGKLLGGTAMKAGVASLDKFVMREVQKQLLSGVSKEVVMEGASQVIRNASATAIKQGTAEVSEFAVRLAASSGASRIATRAGISEISGSAITDAIAGSGFEFLYQRQLVDTGVQDEVNTTSVGLAAIAAIGMGSLAAVKVVSRGSSNTALISEVVQKGSPKKVIDEFKVSAQNYFNQGSKSLDSSTSWTTKVESGKELDVQDTDFFVNLLVGVPSKVDGEPGLKGLGQIMQEQGYYFVKRDEDDKLSNFISDFISDIETDDLKSMISTFEESAGIKLTGLENEAGEITAESFSNAFASKMSNSARALGSAGYVAKMLKIDLKDLTVEKYIEDATGMRILGETEGDALAKSISGRAMDAITAGQNRFIRTLVSHPSTSLLNVLGYGVSSGMGSINDVLRATISLGSGTIRSIVGDAAKGAETQRIAMAVLKANANRVKLLWDNDMTAAAYKSALVRNTGALDKLSKVQAGGIEVATSVKGAVDQTKLGTATESYVNAMQTATFVHAQDVLTKSQEYGFQMDKNLRILFNKSWNDFYTSPDANAMMATKEYKKLEENAVGKTLEHTFSKSYKGTGTLGRVAGVIEEARNIPGLGLMIPFGRFFNNTIDFTAKNTPLLNTTLKLIGGKYTDKTHGELMMQGLVAGGLVYSLAGNEQEKRNQGLGMYDTIDPLTGQIVSQQYDYPLSLFIAAGRYFSYTMSGQKPPKELVARLLKDFGGGGLTRNLTQTGSIIEEAVTAFMIGDIQAGNKFSKEFAGGLGAQLISGFTRPFEPLDLAVGLVAGTEMQPQNVKDGNAFIGKSLSYLSNITQLVTGEPFNVTKISPTRGEIPVMSTKPLGIRTQNLTESLRMMNLLSYDSWKYNATPKAFSLAANAANEYGRAFHEEMEKQATMLNDDPTFLSMGLEGQRREWETRIEAIKKRTMFNLSYNYTGEQSTVFDQITITNKYSEKEVGESMKALDLQGGLGDLTEVEITFLSQHLDMAEFIESSNAPRVGVSRY